MKKDPRVKADNPIWCELSLYGLSSAPFALIREKDGVIVARVFTGKGTAILKAFDEGVSLRELENYRVLISLGVPTLKVCGFASRSILMEDIEASPVLRLGREEDVNDPAVVTAIARWYRLLHGRGLEYVREKGSEMYDEWDLLTEENLRLIKTLGPDCERAVRNLAKVFPSIQKRAEAAPRTLCYNDFYYTNMAVAKDKSFALMFDYNFLGKGSPANDLLNATYDMTGEMRALFLKEYGENCGEELAFARTLSPIVSLISALKRDVFPSWAEEAKAEFLERWG